VSICMTVVRRITTCVVILIAAALSVVSAQPASARSTVMATANENVRIRSGPGVTRQVLGQLDRGQRIPVGRASGRWVKVRFDHRSAYIARRYLNLSGHRVPRGPLRVSAGGTKITTARLNLRIDPSLHSRIVSTVAEGTHLELTGKMAGGFAQIRRHGRLRWVSMQYLPTLFASTAPSPAPVSGAERRGDTALKFARRQLGKPYRYRATGPQAYDCSGLAMMAWREAGVLLPRTSRQQFLAGRRIARSHLRRGDLVFFYGPPPSHVGIYAGGGQIIHAPRPGRTVQYTKISSMPYAGAVRPR
jgi:cell wall-associated NlpC family hydrolase